MARAELDEQRRQLLFEVQIHYAEVVTARERVGVIEGILQNSQENFRLTSARVEKGDAAPLDRQLLVVEWRRSEAQRTSFAGRLSSALLELKRVAGFRADEPVEVARPPDLSETVAPLEGLKARAITNRPDLRSADLL